MDDSHNTTQEKQPFRNQFQRYVTLIVFRIGVFLETRFLQNLGYFDSYSDNLLMYRQAQL